MYRKIDARMWTDEAFLRMTAAEKLAWITLLTHPQMTPMGAGIMSPGMLNDILGGGAEEALQRLEVLGLIFRDQPVGLVIVRNYLAYNPPENVNAMAAWIAQCEHLPRSEAFEALRAHHRTSPGPGLPEWVFSALLDPLAAGQHRGLRACVFERGGHQRRAAASMRKAANQRASAVGTSTLPGIPPPSPGDTPPHTPPPTPTATPGDTPPATQYSVAVLQTPPLNTPPPLVGTPTPLPPPLRPAGLKVPHPRDWIDVLNTTTGRKFHAVDADIRPIRARMAEGFTLDDAREVVTYKFAEWGHDPTLAQYLRPQTLFGPKFQGYLQAARVPVVAAPPKRAGPVERGHPGIRIVKCYQCGERLNANERRPCLKCGAPHDEGKYATV